MIWRTDIMNVWFYLGQQFPIWKFYNFFLIGLLLSSCTITCSICSHFLQYIILKEEINFSGMSLKITKTDNLLYPHEFIPFVISYQPDLSQKSLSQCVVTDILQAEESSRKNFFLRKGGEGKQVWSEELRFSRNFLEFNVPHIRLLFA